MNIKSIDIVCDASKEYFLNWEDIPEDIKKELEENGPIPCEGTGRTFSGCQDCRFCTHYEEN